MKWLLRFLLWATALAPPFWLVGHAYHRALAWTSMAILGIPSGAASTPTPDVPASHGLGVFAALCLASVRTPPRRRLLALAVGLGSLVALELLTGILALRGQLAEAASGATPGLAHRLRDHLTALPAWIGAPVAWLILLGRWELPTARRGPSDRAATARR